jgi:glycosyltransferase involved in cell wall biosynthesis
MSASPLRIGLCHRERLPVRKYGGTERVVLWLARTLVSRGHSVVLLAPPGSHGAGTGAIVQHIPRKIVQQAFDDPSFDADAHLPTGLDVVHFHFGLAARTTRPHIITIHGNEDRTYGPHHSFVSRNHMERHGGRHWVYNGIELQDYVYQPQKDDFLLFLGDPGRRSKGVDRAEKIARVSGRRLVIAGGWRFNPSPRIRSVGPVDDRKKAELLRRARALVFPIRWEEPFGLVVAEAWAAGCPVLASPRGSQPELFETRGDPVGFLCPSDDAFVEALDRLDEIDPAACRAHVERRFSAEVMAENYESLYRRAIAGELEMPFEPGP